MKCDEKKSQIKLGTYSNDGIGTGFSFIQLSKEEIDEMENFVLEDLRNIEGDFIKQYERLKGFISKEIGAISKDEDFAKWFFDRKKITEWGKHLPEISEYDIITGAKEYYKSLKEQLNPKIEKT